MNTQENVRSKLHDYILSHSAWIPKNELIVGGLYLCKARNFNEGIWNGVGFEYIRTKWNSRFKDIEYHWDDLGPFCMLGTAKPYELLELNVTIEALKERENE